MKEAEGEVLGSVLHTGPPTPPPAEMAAAATPVLVAGTEGAAREGTDTRTSSMAAAETAADFFEDSKGLEVFEVFEVLLNDIADTAVCCSISISILKIFFCLFCCCCCCCCE